MGDTHEKIRYANVVRGDNTKTVEAVQSRPRDNEKLPLFWQLLRSSNVMHTSLLMCAAWSDQRTHRLSPRGMVPMFGISSALFRVQALVSAKVPAHLPPSMGVLPLTNAMQTKVAAHWPSWAESISMVRKRQPTIASAMIAGIDRDPVPMFSVNGNLRTSVDRCRSGNPIVDRGCCNTAALYPEPTGQVWQEKKPSGQLQEKFCREVVRPSLSDPVEVATFFWHPPP